MALITTYADFVGSINLPNVTPSTPEGDALALAISQYEQEYLSKMLGFALAKLVGEALSPPAATSGVIYDLINGKDYTDKLDRPNRWVGFRVVGQNAIANYIYCKFKNTNRTITAGIGEVKPNGENMTMALDSAKVADAWNAMVELNYILDDFLNQNIADYPTYSTDYVDNNLFTKTNMFGI
jgi:hypothetical protein